MVKALAAGLSCAALLLACGTLVVPAGDAGVGSEDGAAGGIDADQSDVECGNNATEAGESCDDGNQVSGDGCSEVCLDETLRCVPAQVGPVYTLPRDGGRMLGEDGRLYVAGSRFQTQPRMLILDVSDPSKISEIGGFAHDPDDRPTAKTLGIVKRGDLIWLAGNDPALTAVNVSVPSSASLAHLKLNPESDGHLVLLGPDHLLVSESVAERPAVYNIAGGTANRTATLGSTGDVYYNVGASESLAFAANFSNTIDIFDASNPATPTAVGRYIHSPAWSSASPLQRIVAEGDLMVFSVSGTGAAAGTHLVDVGNPSGPVLRKTLADKPEDLLLRDGFLYLPYPDGIRVYDVRTPAAPVLAGSIVAFDFRGTSVAIEGGHAFVIGEDKLIAIGGLPGLCESICGNNIREYPEACDDGNRTAGDGCSADCSATN